MNQIVIFSHFSPDKSKSSSGSGITKLSGGSGGSGGGLYNFIICIFVHFCTFVFVYVFVAAQWSFDSNNDDGFTTFGISGGSYIPNWSDLFPPPPAYPPRYDGSPNYSIGLPLICSVPPPPSKQAEVILFPFQRLGVPRQHAKGAQELHQYGN